MARKALNIEDLSSLIINEYSWRRKELQVFKSKIPNEKSSLQKPFLRAGVTILYAHWEGFIKNAATYYLQYVSYKFLKHSELKPQFVALCLSNKIKHFEIKKFEIQTKIVEFFISELEKRSNVPYKTIVNTKSNLRFEVLKEIFFTIGLNENKIIAKECLINDLVDLRNTIAHGENKDIDLETYNSFYSEIIQLMEDIKTEIENSAFSEIYKRKPPY